MYTRILSLAAFFLYTLGMNAQQFVPDTEVKGSNEGSKIAIVVSNDIETETEESESSFSFSEEHPLKTHALPTSSFNINPLGLFQFGPIFQYEHMIGEQTYIVPYFRYAFAGVVTHAIWTEFDEDSKLSPGSAALGLGVKSFATDDDSWYYGGFLDFSWTKATYSVGFIDETEEKASNLGVISNFGYRWRSDSGSYINVGLFAGAAFTLKDEERFTSNGQLFAEYNDTTIFAMLELSFGWEK